MDTLIGRLTGEAEPVPAAAPAEPDFPTIVIPEDDWPEEPEGNTTYYRPAASGETRTTKDTRRVETEAEEKSRTKKLGLTSMAITLPILLLALILTFWILFGGRNHGGGTSSSENSVDSTVSDEWLVPSKEESELSFSSRDESSRGESSAESSEESSQEESSEEVLKMEDFKGQKYADVIANAKNKAIYIFAEPEYVYSSEYEEGIVVDQDVTPDIEITTGTQVRLKVSKGTPYLILPSYDKKTEKEYLNELAAMGITNVAVSRRRDPLFNQGGYVVGTNMSDGQYDIVNKPLLEIYVSIGAEDE